jgi:hypothetical protein
MSAQTNFNATGLVSGMVAYGRHAALLLIVVVATLFPVKEAKAESAIDVLFKVCDQVKNLCGPDYPAVAKGCFAKGADELACALAIINVASGGQSSEGIKRVNAIVACINAVPDLGNKAKFDAVCKPLLQEAGVNVGKIDEVYGIASKCGNADDVDDFIYCADTLIDSSIAEEADLGIPTWVNSLFDIYIDIDQKDYWGLVYNVGATVACAVANYFLGTDVCAFLADIAEFAGDVADGAKAVGSALNNAGEKVFTGQTKHEPLPDFFNRYWLPDVDAYAQNVAVKQDGKYWDSNIGEKMKHCRNYFEGHTMAADKSCRVCVDMRDGMTATDKCNGKPNVSEFPDKGFTQLASRRGAIMLLPGLIRTAAQARIAQLRAQGAFKAATLPGPQVPYDPWKSAQEVPGVEAAVYRAYGLGANGDVNESPFKRDAKTVNEAWRTKTVGYGAYMLAQAAKVAPGTLNFPTSEAIAKKSIASGETGVDVVAEVKAFIASAQAERMKAVDALVNLNKNVKDSQQKPLNDALALCVPKATAICQDEVRERFGVCDAKAKAYYDANAAAIGDFDSSAGRAANKRWGEIRETCEAEVRAYVASLPNVPGNSSGTQSCQQYLGRPVELLCPDSASFLACRSQVDIGKLKTCRQTGVQQPYTKPSGAAPSGPGTINPGVPTSVPAKLGGGTGTLNAGTAAIVKDAAARKDCKSYLGRADEMLCPDAASFSACKAQVDSGKLKTCRQEGMTQAYSKPPVPSPVPTPAVTGTPLGGGTPPLTGLKPGGSTAPPPVPAAVSPAPAIAPPAPKMVPPAPKTAPPAPVLAPAAPKVDEAALRTCKPFLGRANELLCSDARSFAACKTAVDIGQMKTCRVMGSTDVYTKR